MGAALTSQTVGHFPAEELCSEDLRALSLVASALDQGVYGGQGEVEGEGATCAYTSEGVDVLNRRTTVAC